MAYDRYFFTGVVPSGARYVARPDGEYAGTYATWKEANDALKKAIRK